MLTGHPLTRHICAAQFDHSAERTHNALGSRPSVICKHLCVPKQVLSSGVSHVSSMVVLSRAFLHEHFLFFTYVSNHTTRTLSTSRTSPRSPSRQVAPSRITLARRPAEWRKPVHNNFHTIKFAVFVDVQLRKESHQDAFHVADFELFVG